MFLKRNIDPNLEKLRDEVEGPPNLDTFILNIQRWTSKIHASYLFDKMGLSILQQLCLLLSSTSSGKLYNGWQEFAIRLGLSVEQIRCIENDLKGPQDSTYYVLAAFVQSPDAYLDKVFVSLHEIGRLDIINRIKDSVEILLNYIVSDQTEIAAHVCRPEVLPKVPLVLRPAIQAVDEKTDDKYPSSTRENSGLRSTGSSYGSIVMLTFAEDGMKTAESIARIFRSKQPKIGVLMLKEQEKHVYSKSEEFIDDCIRQVNYVIPILTRGYLEKINNADAKDDSRIVWTTLDAKYLKYIYTLLRIEYSRNNCCNSRVRCIVPDEEVSTIMKPLNIHPILQAWFRESDVEAFANHILLKKF